MTRILCSEMEVLVLYVVQEIKVFPHRLRIFSCNFLILRKYYSLAYISSEICNLIYHHIV